MLNPFNHSYDGHSHKHNTRRAFRNGSHLFKRVDSFECDSNEGIFSQHGWRDNIEFVYDKFESEPFPQHTLDYTVWLNSFDKQSKHLIRSKVSQGTHKVFGKATALFMRSA